MGFLGIVILFLFAFARCQAYKIPEHNNPKMIDFAGMSSTKRKTALATLLNLLSGVDRRDEAKEVMNYQKCYNVIEFVSMTDADIESFTLWKKEGKELVQQLLPMTVISWIKQLKNFTSHRVTDSDQTVLSAITTAMFETWVLQQMYNKDVPNDARRMEAIDKFNIKDLNPFNGSTVDWPGTLEKQPRLLRTGVWVTIRIAWLGLANQISPFSPSPTLNLIHKRDLIGAPTARYPHSRVV